MKIPKEVAREIIYDDNDDWEKLDETEQIVDQRRWETVSEAVFHHIPTDKFYQVCWEQGSTEYQHHELFEYEDPEFVEVEEKEVLIKKWVAVENKNDRKN